MDASVNADGVPKRGGCRQPSAPATVYATVAGPRDGHRALPSEPPPGVGRRGGRPASAPAEAGVRRRGDAPVDVAGVRQCAWAPESAARSRRARASFDHDAEDSASLPSLSLSLLLQRTLPRATYLPRYEKSWLGVGPKIWCQRLGRFYAQTANKKSGSFFDHLNDFWSYGSP